MPSTRHGEQGCKEMCNYPQPSKGYPPEALCRVSAGNLEISHVPSSVFSVPALVQTHQRGLPLAAPQEWF